MKRAIRLLFGTMLLVTACTKEEIPAPVMEISSARVALAGNEGATARIMITTSGRWEATVLGEGFDVSMLSGEAGESVVTITSTRDNELDERQTLGSVTFSLSDYINRKEPVAGTSQTLEVMQSPRTVPHTVLLYMPGRSLLSFYRKNIEGICDAVGEQMPGNSRIIVCWQPKSHTSASLCEIRYDYATREPQTEELEVLDFVNDKDNIKSMMQMVAEYAPADSYGLIVGCHGKAWLPVSAGIITNQSVQAATQSDNIWSPLAGAKPTRSFGDRGHDIDIGDFTAVLSAIDYRFNYIIFDACFMANIETLHDLRHSTDYVVSSPCEIMAAGFPYDRFMRYLFNNNGTLESRLTSVCSEFYNFYQNDWEDYQNNEQSGCISLCVTGHLDALTDVVGRIYTEPAAEYDLETIQSYEGLRNHIFYDLGDWIRTVYPSSALHEEFQEALDAAFPPAARLNTAAFYSAYNGALNPIEEGGYSGVTTSEPSTRYREYYLLTDWFSTISRQ